MHYYFSEEITKESVNNLIEKLEGEEAIDLWFATNGGSTSAMKCLISYFNSLGDKIRITLTDRICSAGVDLLLDYTGKLTYEELDFILIHKCSRNINSVKDVKSKLLKQDEIDNKIYAEKLRNRGLTKKQIERFNKGKDVTIYAEGFKQINL